MVQGCAFFSGPKVKLDGMIDVVKGCKKMILVFHAMRVNLAGMSYNQ